MPRSDYKATELSKKFILPRKFPNWQEWSLTTRKSALERLNVKCSNPDSNLRGFKILFSSFLRLEHFFNVSTRYEGRQRRTYSELFQRL